MKIKKFILITLVFFSLINKSIAKIEIIVSVNDKIITNHDIIKESNYLKILNPNFHKLKEYQKLEIAKNYLIDEAIKEKELKKVFNFEDDKEIIHNYFKDLYLNLGFENEERFENFLNPINDYGLSEIKKKIKIEILWNEFIFLKFKNQIKIDQEKIQKKVNKLRNNTQKEYLLSEIVFKKKKNFTVEELLDRIKLSIKEIGFENTANIFSISDSSKYGGKIGWIKEISLNEIINEKLKNKKRNEYSDLIKLGNNYMIIKIEDIREVKNGIDEKNEIEKITKFEMNSQLNKFSNIYFQKVKLNYQINEK